MSRLLLNTLYVQTQQTYLHLDHDTLRVEQDGSPSHQIPLHHLGALALFGNIAISPFLLHRCAQDGRDVAWYSLYGRFQGRLVGATSGNVLLRRAQHLALSDEQRRLALVRDFVEGKLRNARYVLLRAAREELARSFPLERAAQGIESLIRSLAGAPDVETLRGLEGQAAALYFEALPDMIRAEGFSFTQRIKRPPRDPINALLSFIYTLVRGDCTSALEGVGLDPQVGFLHSLRSGRPALALDLMEEFRHSLADRLVLALINRKQITPRHFDARTGGAVLLNEEGRRLVLTAYQKRKQEEVRHPVLKEKVPIGLLPYLQARLLARHLRGDIDRYPAFRIR